MIFGFESFRKWFAEYAGQYVIIGGAACDILFGEDGLEFRATKDIDMVLIIENLTPAFGTRFWEYISMGEYEHINKSTGEPQFYRFTNPKSKDFPFIIELFSRRNEAIALPEDAAITPLPLDEELSSLSAILMDADLSDFLSAMETESVDLEQFGIRNKDQKEILDNIAAAYIKKTPVS